MELIEPTLIIKTGGASFYVPSRFYNSHVENISISFYKFLFRPSGKRLARNHRNRVPDRR